MQNGKKLFMLILSYKSLLSYPVFFFAPFLDESSDILCFKIWNYHNWKAFNYSNSD